MTLPAGPESLPAPAVALVILDGWGIAPPGPGNAVDQADTPVFDELWATYPHTQLTACGRAVGLPEGQMGNSEVGHLNLGAGAVVKQDLTRIDEALVEERRLNDVLAAAMEGTERLHLVGLVSDGGVHSSLEHLEALVGLARDAGVPDVVIHAFTDGRDTSPTVVAVMNSSVSSRSYAARTAASPVPAWWSERPSTSRSRALAVRSCRLSRSMP